MMETGVQIETGIIAFLTKNLDLIIKFIGWFVWLYVRLSLSSSKSLAEGYNSQGTDDCSSNPSPTEAFPENICHNSNPIPS